MRRHWEEKTDYGETPATPDRGDNWSATSAVTPRSDVSHSSQSEADIKAIRESIPYEQLITLSDVLQAEKVRSHTFELALNVLSEVMRAQSLEQLCGIISQRFKEQFNVYSSNLFLVDEEQQSVYTIDYTTGERIDFQLGGYAEDRLIRQGSALFLLTDEEVAGYFANMNRQYDQMTRNALCVPFRGAESTVIGFIELLHKHDENFNDSDVGLLRLYCSVLAVCLNRHVTLATSSSTLRNVGQQLYEVSEAFRTLAEQEGPLQQALLSAFQTHEVFRALHELMKWLVASGRRIGDALGAEEMIVIALDEEGTLHHVEPDGAETKDSEAAEGISSLGRKLGSLSQTKLLKRCCDERVTLVCSSEETVSLIVSSHSMASPAYPLSLLLTNLARAGTPSGD